MEEDQLKEIKNLFLNEIEKTEQYIKDYEELSKPIAPDVAIGRISRMDAINNKSINEAALRNAKEKLQALNYALTKINSEEFDKCARCGNQIPIQRIVLRPQSVYCVRCAR
jgi:DnaK suppressor protein